MDFDIDRKIETALKAIAKGAADAGATIGEHVVELGTSMSDGRATPEELYETGLIAEEFYAAMRQVALEVAKEGSQPPMFKPT